jgi:hypothetical protein
MKSLHFIVVGPFEGIYHICYRISGTPFYSSYETTKTKLSAELRVGQLNSVADEVEREEGNSK